MLTGVFNSKIKIYHRTKHGVLKERPPTIILYWTWHSERRKLLLIKKMKLCKSDNYTFLGNYPATPLLRQHGHVTFCGLPFSMKNLMLKVPINTYFSLKAKCWLRGGVGGQFVVCARISSLFPFVLF